MGHVREHPQENLVWVCPISLGELEWGMRVTTTTDPDRREHCRRYIEEHILDFVHQIDVTTRDSYAEILHRIWIEHPPPNGRDTQQHLSSLGVDVNDVWIAAVAIEHGLTLLTDDRMATIRKCVPALLVANWLV
jgi:predicted nucleic acid-binding protein